MAATAAERTDGHSAVLSSNFRTLQRSISYSSPRFAVPLSPPASSSSNLSDFGAFLAFFRCGFKPQASRNGPS
jgi:hypothetical protein